MLAPVSSRLDQSRANETHAVQTALDAHLQKSICSSNCRWREMKPPVMFPRADKTTLCAENRWCWGNSGFRFQRIGNLVISFCDVRDIQQKIAAIPAGCRSSFIGVRWKRNSARFPAAWLNGYRENAFARFGRDWKRRKLATGPSACFDRAKSNSGRNPVVQSDDCKRSNRCGLPFCSTDAASPCPTAAQIVPQKIRYAQNICPPFNSDLLPQAAALFDCQPDPCASFKVSVIGRTMQSGCPPLWQGRSRSQRNPNLIVNLV